MCPRREPSCSWRRNDRNIDVPSACEDVQLNLDVERHITKSSMAVLLAEDGRSRSRRRPDGHQVRFALGVEPTLCCSLFLSRPQAEVLRLSTCEPPVSRLRLLPEGTASTVSVQAQRPRRTKL